MAAQPPRLVPGPPPLGADLATCRAWVAALPIEMRERLARDFTPSAIRKARKDKRDALLVRMAVGMTGSAEAIAEAVRSRISTYAASGWKYERDRSSPEHARHALAHQVLKLDGGKVLGIDSLLKILRDGKNSAVFSTLIGPRSDHGGDDESPTDDPTEGR